MKSRGLLVAVITVIVILVGVAGFLVYRQNQLQQRLDEQQKASAALEQQKNEQQKADAAALQRQKLEATAALERQKQADAEALEEANRPKFQHRSDKPQAGVVRVMPAQPFSIRFDADTSVMQNIKISGRFSAAGGTDNGIQAFVFDQDNYTNWRNGHQAQSIFQSGTVTVGDIDAAIDQSGIYYIVFSAKGNILARTVDVSHVRIDYDKRIN